MKSKISYEELLEMFRIGSGIDETVFYFDDDPSETDHYIGFLPQYDKPYWAGYCDIKDGTEFETAEQLFNAKIYGGKSIKERWNHLVLTEIGGINTDDL
ncbi:MAG: hypothetical protein E7508_00505 [Ruminococcus sp.]|nr:hypothetical protein [Ruminococcus sp.]